MPNGRLSPTEKAYRQYVLVRELIDELASNAKIGTPKDFFEVVRSIYNLAEVLTEEERLCLAAMSKIDTDMLAWFIRRTQLEHGIA